MIDVEEYGWGDYRVRVTAVTEKGRATAYTRVRQCQFQQSGLWPYIRQVIRAVLKKLDAQAPRGRRA